MAGRVGAPLGVRRESAGKVRAAGAPKRLYFGCTGCARGRLFTAVELVRLYGAEGRVGDLAKRLACKFCKQRRKRPPRVYVEVSRPFYTKAEAAALTATDLDALVYSLEKLKPRGKIA